MLMLLHSLHEVGSIHKTLVCTSVQPSESLTQQLNIQGAILQINAIQIGNLQFTTRRRFQVLCKLDHTVIIEVQASHAIVALRMFWLFLDRNGLTVLVKLHNTKTLWIVHIVAKHRCALAVFCILDCCLQALLQTMTRKDVVAQHHSHRIVTDKVGTNDKCLCQSIRRGLYCIGQIHTKLVSITQQVLETRSILWCGNNQNVTDASVHQNGHRIINHRFIKNG